MEAIPVSSPSYYERPTPDHPYYYQGTYCRPCSGTGRVREARCLACNGMGHILALIPDPTVELDQLQRDLATCKEALKDALMPQLAHLSDSDPATRTPSPGTRIVSSFWCRFNPCRTVFSTADERNAHEDEVHPLHPPKKES